MSSKNFLLLSLEDNRIKKVSNVISNDSCRKILDCLSDKEATESELAVKLQIPISTVHYNLQQLMETGLISADEFHYSQKGKEMVHYRLANKYIIIAPKNTYGIKEKLKGILPIALIASGAALVLQFAQKYFVHSRVTQIFTSTKQTLVRETLITQKAADAAKNAAAEGIAEAGQQTSKALSQAAPEIINKTTEHLTQPETVVKTVTASPSILSNIALWFLAGALFALAVYLLWGLFRDRINGR